MSSILPEGETLRRAIRWIDEQQKQHPDKKLNRLVQEATLKFDLSPRDSDFLWRFYEEVRQQQGKKSQSNE